MLVDKSQFSDGLFAISHKFTTDINSNCTNVKNGAVIFVQNAHGCARRFFAEGSYSQTIGGGYILQILFRRRESARKLYVCLCSHYDIAKV